MIFEKIDVHLKDVMRYSMMVLLVVVVVDWVGAVLRKLSRQIAGLSILKCRRSKRHGFDSWVRKIPRSRKW